MSIPEFSPKSTISSIVLPSTGSYFAVSGTLPFGLYADPSSDLYSTDFISGAVDQVAFTYKRLGGDILDVELTPGNIYSSYEEAVLEYSYILNIHQAKSALHTSLGNTTGTFDHDGVLKSGSLSSSLGDTPLSLRYTKWNFGYARRIGTSISTEAGVGGDVSIYSASFDVTAGVQDYDLQTIISNSAGSSSMGFFNKVGNKRVIVKKVYYKTQRAMWRFFGYYGGLNAVGNLAHYGQYADDSSWEVIPVWQNYLQAQAFEDALYVRTSHYSYKLINNTLRLFPQPDTSIPNKMWVDFLIPDENWDSGDSNKDIGVAGVNNLNTLPYGPIPFKNINSIGKMFIKKYALAICKEMLGLIRSKFDRIPIPNNDISLNGESLVEQGRTEQKEAKEELKEVLDELTYPKLVETSEAMLKSTQEQLRQVPLFIKVI